MKLTAFLIHVGSLYLASAQNTSIHIYPRAPLDPYFEVIATSPVAAIASILVPKTGKVVIMERITGGAEGTTHSVEFDTLTNEFRPLTLFEDSFCGGGIISPETSARIVNAGGYKDDAVQNVVDYTPCGQPGSFGTCDWRDLKSFSPLQIPRWYPTALPLPSGRSAIISGKDVDPFIF
jgi:hypothetical protein